MQIAVAVGTVVWLIGVVCMLTWMTVKYFVMRYRVRENAPLEPGIRQCDRLPGAFVIGVVRPCIYLPSQLPEAQRPYVVAHERAHLQRGDHLWRMLGYVLLSVYWFHPLLWVSYVLMCRDMELACDEKVIKALGKTAIKLCDGDFNDACSFLSAGIEEERTSNKPTRRHPPSRREATKKVQNRNFFEKEGGNGKKHQRTLLR